MDWDAEITRLKRRVEALEAAAGGERTTPAGIAQYGQLGERLSALEGEIAGLRDSIKADMEQRLSEALAGLEAALKPHAPA